MDLHTFLRTRRSVRHFRPDRVSAAVIERMLQSAGFAPSAHNRQPWRFAVLTDPAMKSRLAEAMSPEFRRDLNQDGHSSTEIQALAQRSEARIQAAPLVIVLCLDMSEMDVYPDVRREQAERIMAIQSTANAGLQLLLAAHAEGLGGVWNCAPLFAPKSVVESLDLPSVWEPQGLFLFGFPVEIPPPRLRKPIQAVALFR